MTVRSEEWGVDITHPPSDAHEQVGSFSRAIRIKAIEELVSKHCGNVLHSAILYPPAPREKYYILNAQNRARRDSEGKHKSSKRIIILYVFSFPFRFAMPYDS